MEDKEKHYFRNIKYIVELVREVDFFEGRGFATRLENKSSNKSHKV